MSSQITFFILVLILGFQINVKAEIVEVPKGCKGHVYPCFIHIKAAPEEIQFGAKKIYAQPGSSLEIREGEELHLVRGQFLIQTTEEKLSIYSLYGQLDISAGQVLVTVQDERADFTNISATLKYSPRGEALFHDLPKGYQAHFGPVVTSGVALAAFPGPAEINGLIRLWAKFYSKNQANEFKTDLKDFMSHWNKAINTVRPWYEDTIQREIASLREEERRKRLAKEKANEENQVYRRMFRERVFNP